MPGNKLDDYRVVDTLSAGRFGLKQLVCRLSDRRLFEWRQISYRSMDDALKEVEYATSLLLLLFYLTVLVDGYLRDQFIEETSSP